MKAPGPLRGWQQQLAHRSAGAVVEVRRAGPDAGQIYCDVFAGAADGGLGSWPVAGDLDRAEKLVVQLGLMRAEELGAVRVRPDFVDRAEPAIFLGTRTHV